MTTNNPAFSDTFAQNFEMATTKSTTMTVQGTTLKAFVLLAIVTASAAFSWAGTESGSMSSGLCYGAAFAGFIIALITMFKPTMAMWTAPLYSVCEGIFLGAVSRVFEARYPGIALQAIALTGAVTFLMFFFYATRIIKVTGQLATGIMAATGAIALLYLVAFMMRFFAGAEISFINSPSPIGIAFSVFVVGLAAFNLLLDFDYIERGSNAGLSKSMEWYGAFALMVTLVWLYLEVLRLLGKLRSR